MQPRKSMANSAPTFVGGQQIGAGSTTNQAGSSQFGRSAGPDQGNPNDDDANRSFFDKERDRLIEEIAGVSEGGSTFITMLILFS
jgi:hypothetical protein